MNRLRAASGIPVVAVTAPAGFGKSTLASQWAARDGREFARCTIVADTVESFVDSISAALGTVGVPQKRAVGRGRAEATDVAIARLARELRPGVAVVLDDADLLQSSECAHALETFVGALPRGCQLVVLGRGEAQLKLPRLRVRGQLFELGPDDLAFNDREAAALLRDAGVESSATVARELNRRLGGWPAGLRLAARALRGEGDETDLLREYIRRRILPRLAADDVRFLLRAAVLDRLSGPLCDAVIGTSDSAAILERLEKSSGVVMPVGRERRGYRIQRAVRAALLQELDRPRSESARLLRIRASDWCRQHGDLDAAIAYAQAAHDHERVADLIAGSILPFWSTAPPATVEGWLGALDDVEFLGRHPATAAIGALTHSFAGRTDAALRWSDAIGRHGPSSDVRGGEASVGAWSALVTWSALIRSTLGAVDGPGMRIDAQEALRGLDRRSPWRIVALLTLGEAARLEGDCALADETFARAGEEAHALRIPAVHVLALSLRSLLASSTGKPERARRLATDAAMIADEEALSWGVAAASARIANAAAALRAGDWVSLRTCVDRADQLVSDLTHAVGWFAVELRLELAGVYVGVGAADRAAVLLESVEAITDNQPEPSDLNRRTHELRAQLAAGVGGDTHTPLTAAELRLLPLLTTHMSFREISEQLFLSRNTVKTQAISVYRKLGVSARSEAIDRAATVGLVPARFARSG